MQTNFLFFFTFVPYSAVILCPENGSPNAECNRGGPYEKDLSWFFDGFSGHSFCNEVYFCEDLRPRGRFEGRGLANHVVHEA